MLLPPFGGVPLAAFDREGTDITAQLFAPSGFMKVDADYTAKPYERVARRPTGRRPTRRRATDNVFAVGIAFAPPHQISRPRKSTNGTVIAPSPPRTGMPSGVMGKTAALTIVDRIKHGDDRPAHEASMATMGAACVASAGAGHASRFRRGDDDDAGRARLLRYPTGRDLADTRGEIGLSGHWVKLMMHHLFIYKAKGRLGWQLIPE